MRNLRQFVCSFLPRGFRGSAQVADPKGEAGNAIIELALTLGFFGVPLLLAVGGYAPLLFYSIEVANAAHAGASYGMCSATDAADTANITSAAQADAPDFGTNLTVTPTVYYACATSQGGTQYSTQAAATTACTGTNNSALEFVKVQTTATVSNPFPLNLSFAHVVFPSSFTLSNSSVMEVEE